MDEKSLIKFKQGDRVYVRMEGTDFDGKQGLVIGTHEGKKSVPQDVVLKTKAGDSYLRREFIETPYLHQVVRLDDGRDVPFLEDNLAVASDELPKKKKS